MRRSAGIIGIDYLVLNLPKGHRNLPVPFLAPTANHRRRTKLPKGEVWYNLYKVQNTHKTHKSVLTQCSGSVRAMDRNTPPDEG